MIVCFNLYGNGNAHATIGFTALYHHHGTRYGLGIGGRIASSEETDRYESVKADVLYEDSSDKEHKP